MTPHHRIDWDRLDRYVRGDGTPDELEALRRWVEADPELRSLVEAMQSIGRPAEAGAEPEAHAWDTRVRWQQLERQMRRVGRPLRILGDEEQLAGARRRALAWRAVAAAAAIVVAAGASFLAARAGHRSGQTAVATAPMREVVTGRGQRAVFDLPDGSRVVVAPETRLRVPASYERDAGPRDIHLDGQAFFEVEHDEARPFRVRTASGVAEDLGTEFVVTTYPETRGMQVVVASGVVALSHADTGRALLKLTRGDLGRLDSAGIATLTSNVALAPYVGWATGTLAFDGTPLEDAIPTLARWYDLDIRLADSALGERRLTATIRNQSADQMLELLALSLDLRVRRSGGTVTLSQARR